jgi:uncharacterized protein YndB with AHSA1/START domain
MAETEFAYTTYIKTTPERLWRALTDPAFTRRYWGATFASDWNVGSTVTWQEAGVTIADPAQVVLESEPYRRLAYAWHTFTPAWAKTHWGERGGLRQDRHRAPIEGDLRDRTALRTDELHKCDLDQMAGGCRDPAEGEVVLARNCRCSAGVLPCRPAA